MQSPRNLPRVPLAALLIVALATLSIAWPQRTEERAEAPAEPASRVDAPLLDPDSAKLLAPEPLTSPSLYLDPLEALAEPGELHRFALRHASFSGSSGALPAFEIVIGGAGFYPPRRAVSDEYGEFNVALDFADRLTGEPVEAIEVFARELTERPGALGLWRPLELSALSRGACQHGFACQELALDIARGVQLSARSPSGAPIAGLQARLALDTVGLVHLKERAAAEGLSVDFGPLPEGRYTVHIKAPGYLSEAIQIDHALTPVGLSALSGQRALAYEVELDPGRAIYGVVVDDRGQGVAHAFVTAYIDPYGAPTTRSLESFSRLDTIPIRGVAVADERGYFALSGLPKGIAYLTATGELGVPALSSPIDLRLEREAGPIRVTLLEGADVEVLVVGPQGPLSGARITWRDRATGLQARAVSDAEGLAAFQDVPEGALFEGEFERWRALPVGLDAPEEDGVYRLKLELEPPGARGAIAFRLLEPLKRPVRVTRLVFRGDEGTSCPVQRSPQGARDWVARSCLPSSGWLEVHTDSHGVWTSSIELKEGTIVTMPDPEPIELLLKGWPEPPDAIALEGSVSGSSWRAPVRVFDRRGAHRLYEHDLYPGRYEASFVHRGERVERAFHVGAPAEARRIEWSPHLTHTLTVSLVDDRAHPLKKSYFAVVRPGRHDEVHRDEASPLVTLKERDINQAVFLACGVSSGCVTHVVSREDFDRAELVLQTSGEALQGAGEFGAIEEGEAAAEALGAPLVRDTLRWLIDVRDEQSVAARLGIERGATLILVRRRQQGLEAIWLLPDGTWRSASLKGL